MTHLGGIATPRTGQADEQIVDTEWLTDFILDELPKRFATGCFEHFGQGPAIGQTMVLLDMTGLTRRRHAGNCCGDGVVVGVGHGRHG